MKSMEVFEPAPSGTRELTEQELTEVSGGGFWLPFIGAVAAGITLYEYARWRNRTADRYWCIR